MDTKCKNPSRYSRLGGGTRDNGKEQKILAITRRFSLKEIEDWLNSYSVDWFEFFPKFNTKVDVSYSDVDTELKVEWVKKMMKNDVYAEGNRNPYQHKMARFLKRTGLDYNQALTEIARHCKELHDEGSAIKSAYASKYDNDSPIYVPSMEERAAYYKEKDEKAKAADTKERFSAPAQDLDPNLSEESLLRYIRVGTQYFKKDSERGVLIPWNKDTFRDDYGSKAYPPKCYDDFFYEPDYTSPVPPIETGKFNQYRNHFQRPIYKVEPGEWSVIRSALEHGFGDQFELALKYCAVHVIYPKQKLPVLVMVGPEDTGKSAVVKIIQYMLGQINCVSMKSKDFESEFNSPMVDKQLIVIEEAGSWKDPEAVANLLKDLVTEVDPILVNKKNQAQYQTSFHAKFVLLSNEIEPIKLKGASTRFWVREILNQPPRIQDYHTKIKDEMGHFVWHLIHEIGPTLVYPSVHRLYFSPDEFHTSAKDVMKEFSKGENFSNIRDVFEDFFEAFPEEQECWFDLISLKEKAGLDNTPPKTIKVILKNEWQIATRTNQILRPDSLNFRSEIENSVFNLEGKPQRRSRWYAVTKSQVFPKP